MSRKGRKHEATDENNGVRLYRSHNYYDYGRLDDDLYNMELQRVRNELRNGMSETYPVSRTRREDYDVKKIRRVNGKAVAGIIFSLLTIILFVAGNFFETDFLPGLLEMGLGKSGFGLVSDFANEIKVSSVDFVFGIRLAALLTAVFSVLVLICSAVIAGRPGIGRLMKLLSMLWFLSEFACCVLLLIEKRVLPIGLYIMMLLSIIIAIVMVFSPRKRPRARSGR